MQAIMPFVRSAPLTTFGYERPHKHPISSDGHAARPRSSMCAHITEHLSSADVSSPDAHASDGLRPQPPIVSFIDPQASPVQGGLPSLSSRLRHTSSCRFGFRNNLSVPALEVTSHRLVCITLISTRYTLCKARPHRLSISITSVNLHPTSHRLRRL